MESWKCGGCGKWIAPSVTSCDCQNIQMNIRVIRPIEHFKCTVIIKRESIVDLPSVKIGNQIWATENFDGTKLKDGSTIPIVECNTCWGVLTTPAMCYYDNDKSKGALYNWYAMNELKVPSGWRVPTNDDWGNFVGIKFKETDLNLNYDGFRSKTGAFNSIFRFGYMWSDSKHAVSSSHSYGWNYLIGYNYEYIYSDMTMKGFGLSVRLVRN